MFACQGLWFRYPKKIVCHLTERATAKPPCRPIKYRLSYRLIIPEPIMLIVDWYRRSTQSCFYDTVREFHGKLASAYSVSKAYCHVCHVLPHAWNCPNYRSTTGETFQLQITWSLYLLPQHRDPAPPWTPNIFCALPEFQGCRGYGDSHGDSHGYGYGMGMGTVVNPHGFCG